MIEIVKILWFLLPAGVANMVPVLFKWTPLFSHPVDFNKTFRGKPIFGKNKTFRGFKVGILLAMLTAYIQGLFYPQMIEYSLIDYSSINIYLLGFLLGFGALLGDLVKSFFKRQINISPGSPWPPLDQIDWILGAIILSYFYAPISLTHILIGLLIFGLLHPVVNLLGYLLKIKKTKF